MTPLGSRADVPTDAPARSAEQLVSHLGRRVSVTEDAEGTWTSVVGDARGRITVGDGVLGLRAEAAGEEGLTLVEHVLGSHLERFGARAGLTVTWHRDPS
jgi:uncharacterized protein